MEPTRNIPVAESKKKVKRTVVDRYLSLNLRTPVSIVNDNNNEDLVCLRETDVLNFRHEYTLYCEHQFFMKNRLYLPDASKALSKLPVFTDVFSVEEIIMRNALGAKELIVEMERSESIAFCIDEASVHLLAMLIFGKVNTDLMKRYSRDLPDGATRLQLADEYFENICSQLRLPRRTRAIMKRPKSVC